MILNVHKRETILQAFNYKEELEIYYFIYINIWYYIKLYYNN